MPTVDTVLIAHGELPSQVDSENNVDKMLASIQVNAVSVLALLTVIANRLRSQRSGVIAVIGSVAGDRGRKSNYVYGSAKATVAAFTEGLAGRMKPYGVAIVLIKPGLVDTPMTAAFKKGLLWTSPDSVAKQIVRRVAARQSGAFYAPVHWKLIMLVVRAIPARIFYNLNF
jgi:decaprenylphospho-beta-D-erythro-pentofuranosid-2-ulose 2-reductase